MLCENCAFAVEKRGLSDEVSVAGEKEGEFCGIKRESWALRREESVERVEREDRIVDVASAR